MLIRSATLKDTFVLIDLIHQLGYSLSQDQAEENIRLYLKDPDLGMYVGEVDGRVVGCIAFAICLAFHKAEPQMRVMSLVVDSAYRNQGIGKELILRAEAHARSKSCFAIELTSSLLREKDGTHDFYLAQGYEKNGLQAYFRKFLY